MSMTIEQINKIRAGLLGDYKISPQGIIQSPGNDDRELFPEIPKSQRTIKLVEDSQGFVSEA